MIRIVIRTCGLAYKNTHVIQQFLKWIQSSALLQLQLFFFSHLSQSECDTCTSCKVHIVQQIHQCFRYFIHLLTFRMHSHTQETVNYSTLGTPTIIVTMTTTHVAGRPLTECTTQQLVEGDQTSQKHLTWFRLTSHSKVLLQLSKERDEEEEEEGAQV